MDLDVSFKEERLRSLNLQRVIYEVNMIYDMPARKDKVIATPVRYIDLAINSEIVTANYEETKKYLEENGYSDLLTGTNSLHMLYRYNSIWGGANKDIQSTRSIESLTKKIRNEINRSSKHKSVV
jgi:transposase-like protein